MKPPINKIIGLLLISFFIFTMTSLAVAAPESGKPETKPEQIKEESMDNTKVEVKSAKYVFIIGIDGVSYEDLNSAPNIAGLASAGIKIPDLLNVRPSNLPVSAVSLLSGLEPSNHKYYKKSDKLPQANIFDLYQNSNRKVLFVDGTKKLTDIGGLSKLSRRVGNAKDGVSEVIKTFPKEDPYLTTIFLSINKGEKLDEVDGEIGRLFSFLHQQGVYEYSLFLITGFKGEDAFAVLKGPDLKGGVLQPTARLIDLYPTIVNITDGRVAAKVDGLILWNHLKPKEGITELNLLQKRVNDLTLSQAGLTRSLYASQEEERIALKKEKRAEADRQKISTLIKAKDKEIRTLNLKIGALKFVGFLMIIGFGIGYIIEYFILRKRFLMF